MTGRFRLAFEEVASQLLRGWLIKHQKDMLILFLDSLNIEHEDGVVEDLPKEIPNEELKSAITVLLGKNEREIVVLYLHAFQSMNDAGWTNLEIALETDERLQFD